MGCSDVTSRAFIIIVMIFIIISKLKNSFLRFLFSFRLVRLSIFSGYKNGLTSWTVDPKKFYNHALFSVNVGIYVKKKLFPPTKSRKNHFTKSKNKLYSFFKKNKKLQMWANIAITNPVLMSLITFERIEHCFCLNGKKIINLTLLSFSLAHTFVLLLRNAFEYDGTKKSEMFAVCANRHTLLHTLYQALSHC